VAAVGLDLILFAYAMPAYLAEIETSCRVARCGGKQVALNTVGHLHALGYSLPFLARLSLALSVLLVLIFGAMGLVLFLRRADDPTALLASFTFFLFPITLTDVTNVLSGPWWVVAQVLNFLGGSGIALLLFTFPNGRFVPRWTGWLWAAITLGNAMETVFPSAPFSATRGVATFMALTSSVVAIQVYRFRHVSTPIERQQTKLVVFGVCVALPGALLGTLLTTPTIPLPFTVDTPLYLAIFAVLYVSPLLIPLAFGLAIMRSHLWEIDTIINLALVYGLLTGLLGALYLGSIIGLESLTTAITGPNTANPIVLVVSTLAIAALVQPVRRRLQVLIDRRFYRRKYDTVKVLDRFNASLRHEIDLEQLREQVLLAVHETMQPVFASLWLLPSTPERHGAGVDQARESLDVAPTPHTDLAL
jgi:hypothetical protein